jgi:tetratricopeptide (TPR) repeat protein
MALRLSVAIALALLLVSSGALGASSVSELVREAREHEALHEDDVAVRRYSEALALDPTCSDAYLGLGALRLRLGDPREAERVFSIALSHVPDLRSALVLRARARRALGTLALADSDLEAYTQENADAAVLHELAGWYAAEGNTLAQLEVWRRLLALAERDPVDRASWKDAALTVHGLEYLVSWIDPVGAGGPSATRRGMARIEGAGERHCVTDRQFQA